MMNMETPELKPCPFCGGECKLDSSEMGAAREVWHFVWCPTCKITGGLRKSSEEALLMWNTRTHQEPQWEQMTEETTFGDGQFIVIRRSKHYGYHKMFAQWSSVHGLFFSNSTPVPVSVEDCFIRIPSSN